MVLTFSFLISAAMHVFVSPDVPLSCCVWPQLRFYMSVAGAIVFEDIVIVAYKSTERKLRAPRMKQLSASIQDSSITTSVDDKPADILRKRASTNISAGEMESKSQKAFEADDSKAGPPSSANARHTLPPLGFRILGYLWVAAFEVWSTSKIMYYVVSCQARLEG